MGPGSTQVRLRRLPVGPGRFGTQTCPAPCRGLSRASGSVGTLPRWHRQRSSCGTVSPRRALPGQKHPHAVGTESVCPPRLRSSSQRALHCPRGRISGFVRRSPRLPGWRGPHAGQTPAGSLPGAARRQPGLQSHGRDPCALRQTDLAHHHPRDHHSRWRARAADMCSQSQWHEGRAPLHPPEPDPRRATRGAPGLRPVWTVQAPTARGRGWKLTLQPPSHPAH